MYQGVYFASQLSFWPPPILHFWKILPQGGGKSLPVTKHDRTTLNRPESVSFILNKTRRSIAPPSTPMFIIADLLCDLYWAKNFSLSIYSGGDRKKRTEHCEILVYLLY